MGDVPVDSNCVDGPGPSCELVFIPAFRTEYELDTVSETLFCLQQAITNVNFYEDDVVDPLEDPEGFLESQYRGSACALVMLNGLAEDGKETW